MMQNKKVFQHWTKVLLLLFAIHLTTESEAQLLTTTTTTSLSFDCAPKLKILDINLDKTNYVSFALWENILEVGSQGLPQNGLPENLNESFNEMDNDLFIIQAKVPGEDTDEIAVSLESLDMNGNVVDQVNNLLLKKVPGSNKFFHSKPLLLVMEKDEVDDNFDTQSNISGLNSTWDHVDDIDKDPTIYGVLGGEIKVSYLNNAEADADVCPSDAIKTINVNVYIITDPSGQPYIDPELVVAHLKKAAVILQQACLKLQVNDFEQVSLNGTGVDLENGLDWISTFETSEVETIINLVKDVSNNEKIDLIYVNKILGQQDFGVAMPDFIYNPNNPQLWNSAHLRTCFMAAESTDEVSIAENLSTTIHQMTHVLTNHKHYITDYNPEGDHPNKSNYNLMLATGVDLNNSSISSKRLWGFQVIWMRDNTNIPQ